MDTKKMTATRLKTVLNNAGCYPDSVGTIKVGQYAGCFQVKRSYFYHHGATDEGWGEHVQAVLSTSGISATVLGTEDRWRAWPTTSYLVAFVRVTQ